MSAPTTLVWLRQDLRLADNPALYEAATRSAAVVPVFIWAPQEEGDWPPGGASRWWLHHALKALRDDLQQRRARLILRRGPSLETLRALIDETGAGAVYWNTRYEPALRKRDEKIAEALRAEGITVATFSARLLHKPDAVRTMSGGPYHVFTPFWKKIRSTLIVPDLLPIPGLDATTAPARQPASLPLGTLALLPKIDWAEGLRATWTPGEQHARQRLAYFLDARLSDYDDARNRPGHDGTSTLSPYLHHGELSPRQVWTAVKNEMHNGVTPQAAESWLRQIAWREFSYHLLHHYPETPTAPLKTQFKDFAWTRDAEALERWQKGQTGYPIIDAGMRQLWRTGWMHNRVRMIAASFLTKDLMIPWQDGARWFWDTLVDADLANNTMGWQWSAGCGADAQPFFRIFNPVSQGERYDADGAYIRRWLPELAALPNTYLHKPWTAPTDALHTANLSLGRDYPTPMVDHAVARDRALAAYQKIR